MLKLLRIPVDPCLHAITKPVVLAVWQIAIVYYAVNVVLWIDCYSTHTNITYKSHTMYRLKLFKSTIPVAKIPTEIKMLTKKTLHQRQHCLQLPDIAIRTNDAD